MHAPTKRKLKLAGETLKRLSTDQLRNVHGGLEMRTDACATRPDRFPSWCTCPCAPK